MNTKSHFIKCLLISATLSISLTTNAKAEVRRLVFPADIASGNLSIASPDGGAPPRRTHMAAQGIVTIDVPPNSIVSLDINPRLIESPEKLSKLPTSGIDQISMTYMSMEDDVHRCDKALAAMPLFKQPISLVCTRTDASDVGVLSFKSLNMLTRLDCFMSSVDGSFLKDAKHLQNLTHLSLSNNALKPECTKMLAQIPKLEFIDLALTDLHDDGLLAMGHLKNLKTVHIASNPKITDAGLQSLQNCKNIDRLDISFAKNITDKSIPTFLSLPKLSYLNLDSTKITADGLANLKSLKLWKVVMPQRYNRPDMIKLEKAFKPNILSTGSRSISKEIEVELGPLK